MEVLMIFIKRLLCLPQFLFLTIKDRVIWIYHHGWEIFEGFGLHLYLGRFGEGKTGSMVRDVYNICKEYKVVQVLSNITLYNFPEHTVIKPLTCAQDILDAPENTVILIDELGTIWNSRDFAMSKGKGDERGLPKSVFQFLCQVRHRKIEVFATAQDWADVDVQIRRKIRDVTVCSAAFKHPFTRMITNRVYDSREYDLFYNNPMFAISPFYVDVYVQTDKLRELYNTKEMVATMLKMEYISDAEAKKNQGDVAPSIVGSVDKKAQQKLLAQIKKGGL